ncbi:hypothetical protein JW899_05180 [Candidatus Uhrbacteria bacterium]|nr:hypothetical protein [Candidatus Uhrbacteria bacterium]
MVFLLLVAAGVALLSFAIGLFPCGVVDTAAGCETAFLPLPDAILEGLESVAGTVKWLVSLSGQGISGALIGAISASVTLATVLLIWKALSRADKNIPIIRRWIK